MLIILQLFSTPSIFFKLYACVGVWISSEQMSPSKLHHKRRSLSHFLFHTRSHAIAQHLHRPSSALQSSHFEELSSYLSFYILHNDLDPVNILKERHLFRLPLEDTLELLPDLFLSLLRAMTIRHQDIKVRFKLIDRLTITPSHTQHLSAWSWVNRTWASECKVTEL